MSTKILMLTLHPLLISDLILVGDKDIYFDKDVCVDKLSGLA